jgi:hypothetical protein
MISLVHWQIGENNRLVARVESRPDRAKRSQPRAIGARGQMVPPVIVCKPISVRIRSRLSTPKGPSPFDETSPFSASRLIAPIEANGIAVPDETNPISASPTDRAERTQRSMNPSNAGCAPGLAGRKEVARLTLHGKPCFLEMAWKVKRRGRGNAVFPVTERTQSSVRRDRANRSQWGPRLRRNEPDLAVRAHRAKRSQPPLAVRVSQPDRPAK